MTKSKKRRWYSPQEDRIIAQLIREGKTPEEIARVLPGREAKSIQSHAYRLGLSLAQERNMHIPKTGHVGVRIPGGMAREIYQRYVDQIADAVGANTMTEVVLHALRETAMHLTGNGE